MAKRTPKRLTPLEALIMDCVWDLSEATVRQVRERLKPTKPMAYNTVLTMMRILRDKGFLESRRDGRMDLYTPRVSRKQMGRRSLRELLDRFFEGSAAALVTQLLESTTTNPAEVRAIRKEVNARLSDIEGGEGDTR
jgi:BlaI family transcriptional regulator, penicillinase repressor